MKTLALMGAAAAALVLAGCADDYYGHDYGYRGDYGYDYAGPADVWYDDYYGPYLGGYWDGDEFYFSDRDGHFRRDVDGHFRHERFEGSHMFHANPPR